jgi:ATP-dependent DNA ligase
MNGGKCYGPKSLPRMPESVLFSETLEATASEITEAVKAQGLEGVIAKRRDSLYEPGRRSGAWVKMRVNKSRDLVVGGYVEASKNFDSIVVGYYEGDDLLNAPSIRPKINARMGHPRRTTPVHCISAMWRAIATVFPVICEV